MRNSIGMAQSPIVAAVYHQLLGIHHFLKMADYCNALKNIHLVKLYLL